MADPYLPRGSLCAVCKHKYRDCSGLPFKDMKVVDHYCVGYIVICDNFENENGEDNGKKTTSENDKSK